MGPPQLDLIIQWGYWLIFFAAIIEGEILVLVAGIAISMGYFDFKISLILCVLGALLHDTLFFILGRLWGSAIVKRKPLWQKNIDKADRLIMRYDWMLIIAYRFIYGMRMIIPFVLGLSKLSFTKYLFFSFVGSLLWALIILLLGYYVGSFIVIALNEINLLTLIRENIVLISLFAVIIVVLLILILKKFMKKIIIKCYNNFKKIR